MSHSPLSIYLLTIRGTLAPTSLDAAREVHNKTAGNPAGVAAAKSLGDLSHMVYVPTHPDLLQARQFLIMDQWNNLEGLNTFFADKQVQDGGAMIFTQRDPVVWAPAEGFAGYHCPAPAGRNDRIIGVVRGPVRSHDQARQAHNAIVSKFINRTRGLGNMSHEAYLRLAQPGTPESLEFLAVDTWYNAAGMEELYEDPEFMAGFGELFAGEPTADTWAQPAGEWIEW